MQRTSSSSTYLAVEILVSVHERRQKFRGRSQLYDATTARRRRRIPFCQPHYFGIHFCAVVPVPQPSHLPWVLASPVSSTIVLPFSTANTTAFTVAVSVSSMRGFPGQQRYTRRSSHTLRIRTRDGGRSRGRGLKGARCILSTDSFVSMHRFIDSKTGVRLCLFIRSGR